MTDEKELQPGLVIAARYRIERRLGSGGMGSVYLVQHVHTEERFALKVLHKAVISDSNALERFRREARTPARIDSEYVVRVTDADASQELGGAPFLVMEYLRGEDIDQRIERAGAFSPGSAVNLLKQAAKALDKAHALGIVHRDLKPENLFIVEREDGTHIIKVLDFGIAKFTVSDEDKKISAATRPGAVFGTPLFMSPEALLGRATSPASDVFSAGVTAYVMLAGEAPHGPPAESPFEQAIRQVHHAPVPLASVRPDLPIEVSRVIMGTLSRDPAHRPPMSELRETLIHWAASFEEPIWPLPSVDRTSGVPASGDEPTMRAMGVGVRSHTRDESGVSTSSRDELSGETASRDEHDTGGESPEPSKVSSGP